MPLQPKRLRRWFAAAAILVIVVSVGFFLYARLRAWRALERAPEKIGINVQQSTKGFTLSKSEGGRTIFTVHASNAVQYKEGGRAELHDVSIVVYGHRSDRYDQIYGSDFEYDPQSGNIVSRGEVGIDLEGNAQGPIAPDQAIPIELKNPIHLKTSGLVFNQKTGAAATKEKIEFRIPQANGSAVGASYDSKANALTFGSDVRLETTEGVTILAQRGVVTQNPRRAVLGHARVERASADVQANQVTLFLRDDNSISRMLAVGEVRGATRGANPIRVQAEQADFSVGARDAIQKGVLSGGVKFEQAGASPLQGTAGRAILDFGPGNVLTKVDALDGVRIQHAQRETVGQGAQTVQLDTQALDMFLARSRPERAVTAGQAKIVIHPQTPSPTQGDTIVTAGHFEMSFGRDGRLRGMRGEPDARIVASAPGQPDRISTSQTLDVAFNPVDAAISSIVQQGSVQYNDGQRSASAAKARYTPADGMLVLTGSPRWTETNAATTAQVLRFNRRTGEAAAEGDVKTTYREARQSGGALLAGSDPVHVTAASLVARRDSNTATYSGSARLWQGSNVVEAPVIEFDRAKRSVVAQGARQPVSTVFFQSDSKWKVTPVTVTASTLTYSDDQRRAALQGKVLLRSADGTISANHADILLQPKAGKSGGQGTSGTNQIEEIVAQGNVVLQQPSRKAVGNKLTYTSSDEKYVLTGGRPSIFDAEHGVTTGDSLTFYSRSDTVLVGSESSTPTVTQTHTGK